MKLWHLVDMCSLRILLWLDLELLLLQVAAEGRGSLPPCPQESLPLHDRLHWPVIICKVMFLAELRSTVSDSPSFCIASVFSSGSTECYRLRNNLVPN